MEGCPAGGSDTSDEGGVPCAGAGRGGKREWRTH